LRSWALLASSLFVVSLSLLIPAAFFSIVPPVAAAAGAVVQNDSMWIDPNGELHIFGEVKNTGDVWLHYVQITGTLRDASNAIVDVVFTFTKTMYLPPGEVGGFDLSERDTTKSARVQSYSLVVDPNEATPIMQNLAILNAADSKNSNGELEIVGEVQNHGMSTSTYTEIVGTFYDVNGKVVYVGFTFTSPSDVPAGAKYGFKLTVRSDERTNQIARYSLVAESIEYTSVPETPWPGILMVAALTVGVLALRRKKV
jgi:hypothetical protein